MNVFISLQLSRNDVEFIKILCKKVHANKVDFSTIKFTLKKVSKNTVDISRREIISKKSMWKQRGFFDHRNYIQKSS